MFSRVRPQILPLALVVACHGDTGDTTGTAGPGTTGSTMLAPASSESGEPGESTSTSTTSTPTTTDASTAETTAEPASTGDALPLCPPDVTCVDSFPFSDERDTSMEGKSSLTAYTCAPDTDESGPEIVYRVTVPEAGFLSAAVYAEADADIDVHILSALDPASCLSRGDRHASADVPAGDHWIVADTYAVDGVPLSGAFRIDIGFIVPSLGPCDMEVGEMPRVGDGGDHLAMPATGPIVGEAHLVTQDEPKPYPTTATEDLQEHYALSQSVTGLVMYRDQVWAPLEGGGFYGAGIGDPSLFPALDEGWYVNMYWTAAARPERGTRMILRDPNGTRAVVVAAGYETGPGNLAHIGGTPEESHFYLGTHHLDTLQLGLASDPSLPLGPRTCQ